MPCSFSASYPRSIATATYLSVFLPEVSCDLFFSNEIEIERWHNTCSSFCLSMYLDKIKGELMRIFLGLSVMFFAVNSFAVQSQLCSEVVAKDMQVKSYTYDAPFPSPTNTMTVTVSLADPKTTQCVRTEGTLRYCTVITGNPVVTTEKIVNGYKSTGPDFLQICYSDIGGGNGFGKIVEFYYSRYSDDGNPNELGLTYPSPTTPLVYYVGQNFNQVSPTALSYW